MSTFERKIFIVCPVRNQTKKESKFLSNYVSQLKSMGHYVHYPLEDTNQNDPIGLSIVWENRSAMRDADEVHVYWNPTSQGSNFDVGMLFMAEKPVKLINRENIHRTSHKSLENVLIELDEKYKHYTVRLD